MKTFVITFILFVVSILNINVVDNRDYPEDGYEIYVMDTHIGYYYADDNTFEYILTGK